MGDNLGGNRQGPDGGQSYDDLTSPKFGGGAAASSARPEPSSTGAGRTDSGMLDLADSDERLPWLESEEDYEEERRASGGTAGFLLGALIALAVLIGAIWWLSNRRDATEQVAEGGVIAAPPGPYKEAPKNPGGKTFAGTGDSSYAVSAGQTRPARLGTGEIPGEPASSPAQAAVTKAAELAAKANPAPKAAPAPTPAPTAAATPAVSGVAVQIGAYSTEALAKAAWDRSSQRYDALSGVRYRIQQGRADIGTVYRLQAMAPDAASASALCTRLKSQGLACQVKN